jgi:hypothetical protein
VEELLDSGDPETVLKAVSALSTASGVSIPSPKSPMKNKELHC